ncbi:hypothetical protein HDU91_001317, partial [Kappamyces sp. JEL0680]
MRDTAAQFAIDSPAHSAFPLHESLALDAVGSGPSVSKLHAAPDFLLASASKYAGDYSASTDDYLAKWRSSEDQIMQDRRSRGMMENELHTAKAMITTLGAKLELVQEQHRNDHSSLRDMTRSFGQKERESRDAIDVLTKRLDQESKRVHQLVEELSRSRQNDSSQSQMYKDQIKLMAEKIDHLQSRLEGYVEKSTQVGINLHSATNQLMMESRRNEDAMKSIKMHDMALTTLSTNLDTNFEGFSRKIQMAAQDLFQRIDSEAKARKSLEESIRQDALEFRRMVERHISERVDSLHSYTSAQSEHDRQEIEAITTAFHTKLQRLESATNNAQEQFATLLNQRLQLIESSVVEAELSNKRLETRVQQALTESLQFFEGLMAKKDADSEKRLKDVTKSILAMQKAIHESIHISEKTTEAKIKSLEEVLRAEINARLETDSKITNHIQENKSAIDSVQTQLL